MENTGLTTGTLGKILQAFSLALRRESHVLTQYPDLLWQQMYNRLQWEREEIENLLSLHMEKVVRIAKPEVEGQSTHRIFRSILAMVAKSPSSLDRPFVGIIGLIHCSIELTHRGKLNDS